MDQQAQALYLHRKFTTHSPASWPHATTLEAGGIHNPAGDEEERYHITITQPLGLPYCSGSK